MAYYLSPIGNDQQTDANGNPLVGGKIYTYQAGTSTPYGTYTDNTSGTLQANPIILNTLGLPNSPIWMTGGVAVKYVIKDSSDVTIRTVDNVVGVNDTTNAASEWLDLNLVPTYIGATQFSVVGDQTAVLQVNRRVRTRNTAGYVYGRISVASYATGVTTVTVVNDSGALDSGLSLVSYGFLSFTPASIPYAMYAAAGANTDITSLGGLTTAISGTALGSKIQPITASVAANALTITLNPTTLDFRSSTLGSGTVNTRAVPAAISLTVSSGSTLGTVSGQISRLYVLAIDNAGTVELAVSGGNALLDETNLISTTAEGGAGGADSATTIYSTTARTSVPYRVVGYVESTQATAGTWATNPSTIQGAGGNAVNSLYGFGNGQAWGTVTRTSGTTYYNTTGKPLSIMAQISTAAATPGSVSININATGAMTMAYSFNANATNAVGFCTIPAGASYVLTDTSLTGRTTWEMR